MLRREQPKDRPSHDVPAIQALGHDFLLAVFHFFKRSIARPSARHAEAPGRWVIMADLLDGSRTAESHRRSILQRPRCLLWAKNLRVRRRGDRINLSQCGNLWCGESGLGHEPTRRSLAAVSCLLQIPAAPCCAWGGGSGPGAVSRTAATTASFDDVVCDRQQRWWDTGRASSRS